MEVEDDWLLAGHAGVFAFGLLRKKNSGPNAGLFIDDDVLGGNAVLRFGIGRHFQFQQVGELSVEGAILTASQVIGFLDELQY